MNIIQQYIEKTLKSDESATELYKSHVQARAREILQSMINPNALNKTEPATNSEQTS